jgi:hypothetical protein
VADSFEPAAQPASAFNGTLKSDRTLKAGVTGASAGN